MTSTHWITLILFIIITILTTSVQTKSTFIWQGFKHGWEREFMGFRIPHRVGSFSNYITNQIHRPNPWNAVADVNMTFTPGVDGDYSNPELYYSGISHSGLFVHHGVWNKVFYDSSMGTNAVPSAHTEIVENILIDIDPNLQSYNILLDGISLNMHCETQYQKDGTPCNSDGIWPYDFYARAGNCIAVGNHLQCEISFSLTRGWTPSRGGGKPYNERMDYNVSLLYTIIGGNSSFLTFAGRSNPVTVYTSTRSDVSKGKDSFQLPRPSNLDKVTMGIQGFGFTLLETNHKRRGRYIELLNFGVSNPEKKGNTITYDYSMGVRGTRLVNYADSILYLETLAILTTGEVTPSNKATGEVCYSGFYFSCRRKDITETTISLKTITIQPSH